MKPNILFVNLPSMPLDSIIANFSGENKITQLMTMPLGILYLSSYIKKHNELGSIGILDYVPRINNMSDYNNIDDYITKIALKEADFTPDIIAFSLIFSTSLPFFNLCINTLKLIWPQSISIVGGNHATNCSKELLNNANVDYVALGEGEVAFSKLINQFSNSEKIDVTGIYSKKNINSESQLELCEMVTDLDILPFPDWELIDIEQYIIERGRRRSIGSATDSKAASIMTTRGCPYRCIYCASHTVHGRKMRFRSVENVIEEIKYLYNQYGVSLFIPEDDLFTGNRKQVLNLLSSIKALKIPNCELQFPNALAVNTLDEEIIDAMCEAGMKIATIAIESGSEYVQKHIIKKNVNLKKAKEIVKYFRKKGIIVRCYFILGFPTETKEQMSETVEYAKALGADWNGLMFAAPLVGTEMYNQFVQMGYIKDDVEMWSKAAFAERMFDTSEISAKDLHELLYNANLECNFINNPNKINGQFEKAIELYKDVVEMYPFHIIGWYCIMECYQALGDEKNFRQTKEKISSLIKSDKRAAEMFTKYNNLMPNFEADESLSLHLRNKDGNYYKLSDAAVKQ